MTTVQSRKVGRTPSGPCGPATPDLGQLPRVRRELAPSRVRRRAARVTARSDHHAGLAIPEPFDDERVSAPRDLRDRVDDRAPRERVPRERVPRSPTSETTLLVAREGAHDLSAQQLEIVRPRVRLEHAVRHELPRIRTRAPRSGPSEGFVAAHTREVGCARSYEAPPRAASGDVVQRRLERVQRSHVRPSPEDPQRDVAHVIAPRGRRSAHRVTIARAASLGDDVDELPELVRCRRRQQHRRGLGGVDRRDRPRPITGERGWAESSASTSGSMRTEAPRRPSSCTTARASFGSGSPAPAAASTTASSGVASSRSSRA